MKSFAKLYLKAAALFAMSIVGTGAAVAADLTRVFYPNEAQMAFTVDVPTGWEMTPQEDADGYFEVAGPNGLELSFRVVPGSDIKQAVQDHVDYLEENFSEVQAEEAKEIKINGLDALLMPAKALDEDEVKRDLGAGWFILAGGQIGELWYNVDDSDQAGKAAAIAVLRSLKGK